MLQLLLCVSALVAYSVAIPIDNGVSGNPEIQCGSNIITVSFTTRNTFFGHVYVKGLYNRPGCRNDIQGRTVASIELPFSDCNVNRRRTLNPKGVIVDVTVVVSFHPTFVTKVDRAYLVQCFYMEADKTVSTEIEVSMLTTAFQTQLVPMPVCDYQILQGGPNGDLVQFALVGDQVYHKWNCVSNHEDTFCMTVHSCFVDDGQGDRVDLVNELGCAVDRNLLGNLEYPTDLMGGVETHVFKYADRAQLFFQCQITLLVKEPNAECERRQCPEPGALVTRGRRSAAAEKNATVTMTSTHRRWLPSALPSSSDSTMDVRSQDINTIDLRDSERRLPDRLTHSRRTSYDDRRRLSGVRAAPTGNLCLSASAFGLLLAMVIVLLLAALGSSGYLLLCRSNRK